MLTAAVDAQKPASGGRSGIQRYAPRPDLIESAGFAGVRMPMVSARRRTFSKILADSAWVRENLDRFEHSGALCARVTCAPCAGRHRCRLLASVGCWTTVGSANPTEIEEFFTHLLEERLGYHIVFDRTLGRPCLGLSPRGRFPSQLHRHTRPLVPLRNKSGGVSGELYFLSTLQRVELARTMEI
jgi:hypothetical protein